MITITGPFRSTGLRPVYRAVDDRLRTAYVTMTFGHLHQADILAACTSALASIPDPIPLKD